MAVGPVSYRYNFSVDNNEVDVNDTLKILGVTLDCKLNFVAHVSEQVKKACAKASALRTIRRFIPLDVVCCLYKAYILPHLEYCCTLLLGVGRGQVKKLEDTNNYILRTISGYRKHTPYNHLLNDDDGSVDLERPWLTAPRLVTLSCSAGCGCRGRCGTRIACCICCR